MPIDASIYQNVQPIAPSPSPFDTAQKAMQLSQLGMQQMQMARQMRNQSDMQDALMRNTDPQTGQLDQSGYLSTLGKNNPLLAQQETDRVAAQQKAVAEAQSAKVDAAQKDLTFAGPAIDHLASLPEDQRAAAYQGVVKQVAANGVNTSMMPPEYDPEHFRTLVSMWKDSVPGLQNLVAHANMGETQAKTAEAWANAAKARSETPSGVNAPITASTDPATLVPQMMPKEARTKALEEIKNAQDLSALSPKIMAAFEMGTSKNPVTAAQGQRQFAGLMNTTVKETEGTVRQAAMDSIQKNMAPSGITALPGENDAKRATTLSYLQSKQSAPFNKSYGIDLTKFNSTAPYQPPQKKEGDDDVVSSANAAGPPPPKVGEVKRGHVFLGGDPSMKNSWKAVQ